jgi:hypothetical protein
VHRMNLAHCWYPFPQLAVCTPWIPASCVNPAAVSNLNTNTTKKPPVTAHIARV